MAINLSRSVRWLTRSHAPKGVWVDKPRLTPISLKKPPSRLTCGPIGLPHQVQSYANRTVQEPISPWHVADIALYKEDQGIGQRVGQKKGIPSEYTYLGDLLLMGGSSLASSVGKD